MILQTYEVCNDITKFQIYNENCLYKILSDNIYYNKKYVNIYEIIIPNNAILYYTNSYGYNYKYYSDIIIYKNKITLEDIFIQKNENVQNEIIRDRFLLVSYIVNPTESILQIVIDRMSSYEGEDYYKNLRINYIDDIKAIKYLNIYEKLFKYMTNPSKNVIKYALNLNGHNLQYVKNPLYEEMKIAINQNFVNKIIS
jgi:hypothetical protein